MAVKLDILAFAAHPDDAEMSCGGTLLKHRLLGHKTGIVDLTRGEMGTRGTPETRQKEAEAASKVLGLTIRENLGFRDGFFSIDEEHIFPIIQRIRAYRPDVLLGNAIEDRHPDHGRGAELVARAWFLAGLEKVQTEFEGEKQKAWRPRHLFHYIQDRYNEPSFIVDITEVYRDRQKAIEAYASQFYDPNSKESKTYISSKVFWDFLEARARDMGHKIGTEFGEGFVSKKKIGIPNMSVIP